MENQKQKFTQTLKGKIILSFASILVVLLLSFVINRVAFQRMTSIINDLSAPNEKLIALTHLHRNVAELMDLQRIEAMGDNREPSERFVNETENVESKLDTLRLLFETEPLQLKRINSIDSLMSMRNQLFLKYLKVRYNYVKKGVLDKQLHALSSQIDKENLKVDSNVVTTAKSVKTTTIIPGEQAPPKKKRWFSKKTNATVKPQVIIEEKTDVKIDTLAIASRDSILSKIENSIADIETDRNQSRKYLKDKEMDLIRTNDLLISELLHIIREVEKGEMLHVKAKNRETLEVADETIAFMRNISIAFALLASILVILMITDISKSNRYRSELEIAKAEAEYHSAAKQRFLANMSHEIRTPLQSIIGYAEQLEATEHTEAIRGSAQHLLQVVNEILDYSRIISGKFSFEKKAFDLHETVSEVTKSIQLQAEKKGLALNVTLPDSNIEVLGDAFRLRQILYNLLGNAVKFTEQGNVSLHVSATQDKNAYKLQFEIADQGAGLKQEDLVNIFNQFEQAQNAHQTTGTGLGLSIVKELVEAQGGKIAVESEYGKGSCFRFFLIYESVDEVAEEMQTNDQTVLNFQGKVWVVDDDELILSLCKIIFNKHQIRHSCFNTAEKLLSEEMDAEVKLIFSDVRLPGMSGIDLVSELKKRDAQMPIIALTAQVLPEEKEHLLQNGYDDLLLKPFTEKQLLQKLNEGQNKTDGAQNLEYGYENLKQMISDPEDLKAIILQFKTDMRIDLTQLKTAIEQKDKETITLLIHRIAGRLGQMGETSVSGKWRQMEIKLRKNDTLPEDELTALMETVKL